MTTTARTASSPARALNRVTNGFFPIVQGTAAATLAWFIARHVVGNHEPFFAPIAAVIALNTELGRRGTNTLRLVAGVFIGICAGELGIALLGRGYGALGLATFAAMTVARAVGGIRLVIAQAAAGAILTVAVAQEQAGIGRFVDALIGAGVALVFSQALFSPQPVRLLRRAEAAALTEMSGSLSQTADALERHDRELIEAAVIGLRRLRDSLAELHLTREASTATARHSLVWRSQLPPAVGERERAGHLDLLGGSCLMLARIAMATAQEDRAILAPRVRELAAILADLGQAPGDKTRRQSAANRARATARWLEGEHVPQGATLSAAAVAVRMVAADLMLFAGVATEAPQ